MSIKRGEPCKDCGGKMTPSQDEPGVAVCGDCGYDTKFVSARGNADYLLEKISCASALGHLDLVEEGTRISLDLDGHMPEDVFEFAKKVNAASWQAIKQPGATVYNTPGFKVTRL